LKYYHDLNLIVKEDRLGLSIAVTRIFWSKNKKYLDFHKKQAL